MMTRAALPVVIVLSVGLGGVASPRAGADNASDKFKLSLRASPPAAMAPARVTVTAQLEGDGDESRCYCPTIEWDWGDGTLSRRTADCDPYNAGKSKMDRFFVAMHDFSQGGRYQVRLRLRKGDETVVSGHVVVMIRSRGGALGGGPGS